MHGTLREVCNLKGRKGFDVPRFLGPCRICYEWLRKRFWGAVGRLDAAGCKDLDNVCGARPILPTGTMTEYIYMIE